MRNDERKASCYDILLFALLFVIIHKNEIEVLWLNEFCDARGSNFVVLLTFFESLEFRINPN